MQADGQLRAQRALLNVSMIPLTQIKDRLAHAVRSQSRRLGKSVSFKMEGGDLLLDGRIAESLFDPLMHLINNAVDHGIEETSADRVALGKPAEALLTIRGRANGDGVVIEVVDDGAVLILSASPQWRSRWHRVRAGSSRDGRTRAPGSDLAFWLQHGKQC